jgi:DNA invertase Pin-like site-specific DNA recombinase
MSPKRAAIYLRVSTGDQTVENQRLELEAAASQRGWTVSKIYSDAGISGATGREKRPGLDAMLKDATKGKIDVVMAWAVDRMGRSLSDLIGTMQELHGAKVDLFLHQQAIDTTTPAGRAMFQMMGVFAEFERSMIQARIMAGLARAKAETPEQRREKGKKAIGRPKLSNDKVKAVRASLAAGISIGRTVANCGVGSGTVQAIKKAMQAESRL